MDGQSLSKMVTRHSILGDTLPIPKAKGMSMRNWMACFLLMTRKVKIKVQKKETTKPCKLLHS